MLTAPNLTPKDIELVRREIQEIRDALEAFKTAVEAGAISGYKHSCDRMMDRETVPVAIRNWLQEECELIDTRGPSV
jgi:hypothetical protein